MSRERALVITALLKDVVERQLKASANETTIDPTRLIDHFVNTAAMVIDMALDAGDIKGDDKTTDGFHTFAELYDHRITLYIALCKTLRHDSPQLVWRSRLHSDGTKFPGWFVLGIGTEPGHQITYHLPDTRWNETNDICELDQAPAFDGHTSADVLTRLRDL